MKEHMKKIVLAVIALLAIAICLSVAFHQRQENKRLSDNIEALNSEMESYQIKDSINVSAVSQLEIRANELAMYNEDLAEQCSALRIKTKRLESASQQILESHLDVNSKIRDTIVIINNKIDTIRTFSWSDNWCSVAGEINNEDVNCEIASVDTIDQIIHRIPHRFLGIPFGTKGIRQEIVSHNPHSEIVFSESLTFR